MSYIANKHNMANITNIHYYDSVAGAWGPNLLGMALPYGLLPAVPANNDAIYFGIDTAMLDSGPFCSLVFNLATAAVYTGGSFMTWQYWNGGWVNLTVRDNTDGDGVMAGRPFDTAGVNSVHWIQPADWVVNDPGVGVTGYWVRCIATIGGGTSITTPVQQNQHVYTITWPFFEVEDTAVLGDVSAFLAMTVENQSGHVGAGLVLYSDRIVMGLRSTSRGANFSAYINMADEQNPNGITITPVAPDSAFANDVTTPTGRRITYAPGVNRAMASEAYIIFDNTIEPHYRGRFRAFLRCQQSGGAAGDIGAQISTSVDVTGTSFRYLSDVEYTQRTGDWETIDFGIIRIPPFPVRSDEATTTFYLIVRLSNTNGAAASLHLYDLVLIPIDEWAADTMDYFEPGGTSYSALGYNDALLVDSVGFPKRTIRTHPLIVSSGYISGVFRVVTGGPAILQSNATQRMWTFVEQVSAASWPRRPHPWIAHSVTADMVYRYFSMRGDR